MLDLSSSSGRESERTGEELERDGLGEASHGGREGVETAAFRFEKTEVRSCIEAEKGRLLVRLPASLEGVREKNDDLVELELLWRRGRALSSWPELVERLRKTAPLARSRRKLNARPVVEPVCSTLDSIVVRSRLDEPACFFRPSIPTRSTFSNSIRGVGGKPKRIRELPLFSQSRLFRMIFPARGLHNSLLSALLSALLATSYLVECFSEFYPWVPLPTASAFYAQRTRARCSHKRLDSSW